MNNTKTIQDKANFSKLLPVLFSFFVMGFVDIVGTVTNCIKTDLSLSNTLAGLLPNFIFIWFLICSIPVGFLMNRIGRKNTVQISNVITIIGMLVPLPMILGLVEINLITYLITFALLGIGNTILQVALNPLLTNITEKKRLASSMTFGQFIKALSSLLGPQIVLFATVKLNDWNYVFLIYATVTILSAIWLSLTHIPMEEKVELKNANFSNVFRLLKDKYLLSLFFCILLIVGIDIGMNFFIPIIFSDVFGLEHATNINTLYFAARALGSLLCALMLVRFSPKKILMWTMIVSILAYLLMMWLASTPTSSVFVKVLFCLMFLPVGFATANVFAIVFSFALQYKPENADQISSLLIMGVAGGGAITFSMGIISDTFGIVGGMSVLLLCMIYIMVTSIYILRKKM